MLTNLSNNENVRIHNHNTHQLKPLKIAKRTNKKVLNLNSKHIIDLNIEKVPASVKYQTNRDNRREVNDEEAVKMIDEPNYRFNKIFSNPKNIINPFYEYTHFGAITDDIDLTGNISFFKNIVKKYNKPLNISYVEPITYTISRKGKIIKPQSQLDPISQCFKHSSGDNQLRFGDYLFIVEQDGIAEMKLDPIPKMTSKYVDYNYDTEEEERLYKSDEGETSRLENSDIDLSEDESDVDIELDISVDTPIVSSPIKNQNSLKKQFQDNNVFKTIKNKASPIKSLKEKRFGMANKPAGKFNYSKFDNSMTISAKAIMKMVDDSLVSSDTEVYNNSLSFMKNTTTTINTSKNIFNLNINEDDLMSAMSINDIEIPFLSKLKDLKL